MYSEELHSYVESNDFENASDLVMTELGGVIANNKPDFVYLLNNAGVPADLSMNERQLVDAYTSNVNGNEKLLVGSAYLINHCNKNMGADGQLEDVDDLSVKRTYDVLYMNFSGEEDSEEFSNALAGSIAEGVGQVAKLGQGFQASSKKGMEAAAARDKAALKLSKQQLLQTALEQKSKKGEISSQTKKYLIIGGVSILAIGIIALVVYKLKKK